MFVIEKSSDGTRFSRIAEIPGAVQSSTFLQYSYTDDKPFEGTNYYRLLQVDLDGRREYNHVVRAVCNKETRTRIVPNPVSSMLELWPDRDAKINSIKIYDLAGRLQLAKQITAVEGSSIKIDVNHLPAGVYLLQTTRKDGREGEWLKFVKQ